MSLLRMLVRRACSRSVEHTLRAKYSTHESVATLKYSEEVIEARVAGRPLVALESTIITHGMPYPHNLETALQVEDIIREQGAVPATIAILQGELTIGLTKDQLTYLSQAKNVVKASRRDLAPIMAAGRDGATTVAGTIIAATLGQIPIFVTGGIGGVHREGESTLDISADLTELGRNPTLVVCGGVKSILDIGRTLEYLETQGVCVCSYGDTEDFPAFYTPRSGFKAPHRVADAVSAAKLMIAAKQLNLSSGIVVAVPVPEDDAMDDTVIKRAIDDALKEANRKGIKGKEVTPYILAAVVAATSGASLATNISLIKNNARVGATIAVEFNRLLNDQNVNTAPKTSNIKLSRSSTTCTPNILRKLHTSCKANSKFEDFPMLKGADVSAPVLVIGGSNVDRTYTLLEDNVKLDGSTHPCASGVSAGGVGRNVAEALWRLRGAGGVRLLTAVADDDDGRLLEQTTPGLMLDGCVIKDGRTASYSAVMDAKGECLLGLGDMLAHNEITAEMVEKHLAVLKRAPLVVLDGNAPQQTIDYVLEQCHLHRKPVFFEPTDKRKAAKCINRGYPLAFASPNINELTAMVEALTPGCSSLSEDVVQKATQLCHQLSDQVDHLIVTLGPRGVLAASSNVRFDSKVRLYPIELVKNVVNVSGAGDCFTSGFIHGMLLGLNESLCISVGFQAAKTALFTNKAVPDKFMIKIQ